MNRLNFKAYCDCIILKYKDYELNTDGTLERCKIGKRLFKNIGEAQKFLDKWMPRNGWLTQEQVCEESQKGDKEALDCSIEHWKQIVLDVKESGNQLGPYTCAMCQRYGSCKRCPVNHYEKYSDTHLLAGCCKEYDDFAAHETLDNAIKMLNKLVSLRNRMFGNPYLETKEMKEIEIDGRMFSEDTIKEALKNHVDFTVKEVPHQFKAGEVVETPEGGRRIIVKERKTGRLAAYFRDGYWASDEQDFQKWNYKKIGRISDFIK